VVGGADPDRSRRRCAGRSHAAVRAKTKKETVNLTLREYAARHRRIAAYEHYAGLAQGWDAEWRERRSRGAHRGLSVADLIVCATAAHHGLVVLHEDQDFATVAHCLTDVSERNVRDLLSAVRGRSSPITGSQ